MNTVDKLLKQLDKEIGVDQNDDAVFHLSVQGTDMKTIVKGNGVKIAGLITNLCVESPEHILHLTAGMEMAKRHLDRQEEIKSNPNIN